MANYPVCDRIANQTTRRPPERIKALNAWMKDYAARHNAVPTMPAMR